MTPQPGAAGPGDITLLGRLLLTRSVLAKTFGFRFIPVLVFAWWCFVRVLVWVGQGLDRLLPARRAPQAPILVAGVPRSGTTFLHRRLAADGAGAGSQLFRMVFPSVVLQRVLRPLLPALEWASPTRFHRSEAHEGSLLLEETDDALAMLRFHDGFLWYAFFLAWHDEDLLHLVDPHQRDTFGRDLAWGERAWAASARAQGRERWLIKSFVWSAQLPRVLERFPDARVVVLLRDPARTIPSAISLVRGPLDRALGADRLDPALQTRHARRLSQALVQLYLAFCEDWSAGRIDPARVKVVPYPRLVQDFEGVMAELCPFLGLEHGPERQALYAQIGAEQRARISRHRYSAGRFGLDEAQIRRDCERVYQTFGPLDEPAPESP